MREDVPLLKCNDLRSGSGTIQRELYRPEGGAWMLLSNRDLRSCCAHTGSGEGVLPGRLHLRHRAKAPDRPIEWPNLKKEDRARRRPQQPVQLSVVLSFPLQDLEIAVWLECRCCGCGGSCWCARRLGIVIGAPGQDPSRNQQPYGRRISMPPILCSHHSIVGKAAVQNNQVLQPGVFSPTVWLSRTR